MHTQQKYFDTPPLRYTGSKWMLAEWIIDQFPVHELYCEPFAGGAAVFFRKAPSKIEVLNDLSGDLVNFFRVLRERTGELINAIELTPFSREEYNLAYEPSTDSLEQARRFYVLCRQAFGGVAGRRTGWRTQKNWNRGTSITNEWRRLDGLFSAVERLKDAQIENRPAIEVIQAYDGLRSLFYIDPPYVLSSRSQGVGRKRYQYEMTDDEHRQLADCLHHIKGMAIVSGYDCPLYREIFRGWTITNKSTTTNGNGSAIEYLWHSPNCFKSKLPLFAIGGY